MTKGKAFIEEIMPNNLLEQAIEWISSNMEPEDVFSKERLLEYAQALSPEDVFSEEALVEWADRSE